MVDGARQACAVTRRTHPSHATVIRHTTVIDRGKAFLTSAWRLPKAACACAASVPSGCRRRLLTQALYPRIKSGSWASTAFSRPAHEVTRPKTRFHAIVPLSIAERWLHVATIAAIDSRKAQRFQSRTSGGITGGRFRYRTFLRRNRKCNTHGEHYGDCERHNSHDRPPWFQHPERVEHATSFYAH
jgi:hypothetical protein